MDVKVGSYNIRIDIDIDGDNNWNFRKEALVNQINQMDFDFIGIQEARNSQYKYLAENSKYKLFGRGRSEESDPNNEACPILYNQDRFEFEKGDTFWVSETPDKISKYKDADCIRIAVWGLFRHIQTGKKIVFINTHLDHISSKARVFGATMLSNFINNNFSDIPVFLTGDFNENENGEWHKVFEQNGMFDSRETTKNPHIGPYGTSTGYAFEKAVDISDFIHIDFIFANKYVTIKSAVTFDEMNNGKLLSDHFLVYALANIE